QKLTQALSNVHLVCHRVIRGEIADDPDSLYRGLQQAEKKIQQLRQTVALPERLTRQIIQLEDHLCLARDWDEVQSKKDTLSNHLDHSLEDWHEHWSDTLEMLGVVPLDFGQTTYCRVLHHAISIKKLYDETVEPI